MERHSENALAVAKWLEARDEVEWVAYPGLASSQWNDAGEEVPAERVGRDRRVRHQGRARGGHEVHRQPRAVQPPRQRRRRAQPRDPPRDHHAPAARGRRAGRHRRHRRPRAPVGRHRVASTTSTPTWKRASAPPRRDVSDSRPCPSPARGASVTSRAAAVRRRFDHPLPLEAGGYARRRSPSRTRRGERSRPTRRTRCSCCTRSPATATPPAPRTGPRRARLVGRRHRARRADRHRPLLRRVPERARRLPGHDRPGVGSRPTAGRTDRASRSSRSATRSRSRPRSPTRSASTAGTRSSAGRWAACACSSGRSRTRSACRAR